MKLRVRVSGHERLGRLARRLREAADGGLVDDARAELVRAAPPVLARTQAAVRAAAFPNVPSKGGGNGTGLRQRLAAATTTEPLRDGVRFAVNGAVVSPDRPRAGHRLAQLTDTELAPRWRHPTFDNRERWTTQRGQPWFFSTIRAARPSYEAAIERACDKTARRIER